MTRLSIDPSGTFLTLDGHRFHAIWLRDNASDAATRAPGNGQRLLTIADIPADTTIATATLQGEALEVTFAPEAKTVRFDPLWLAANAYDLTPDRPPGWTAPGLTLWDATLAPPGGDLAQLSLGGAPLRDWLGHVVRYGFARVTNGPVEPGALRNRREPGGRPPCGSISTAASEERRPAHPVRSAGCRDIRPARPWCRRREARRPRPDVRRCAEPP